MTGECSDGIRLVKLVLLIGQFLNDPAMAVQYFLAGNLRRNPALVQDKDGKKEIKECVRKEDTAHRFHPRWCEAHGFIPDISTFGLLGHEDRRNPYCEYADMERPHTRPHRLRIDPEEGGKVCKATQ